MRWRSSSIGYAAIERDPQRLADAIADGYRVSFGDLADPRIWEPLAMSRPPESWR